MPTSYEVLYLGQLPLIDTVQGDEIAENAAALLGTYGSAGNPLYDRIRNLSPVRLSEDANDTYDVDNNGGFDSFSINGGAAQNFDAVAIYNATITYIDGTTATVTAVVFQDVNGNTYLAPETTQNADQNAYEAKPIQSITFTSVASNTGDSGGDMQADRVAGDFKGPVDGTAGADNMAVGYTDAQGDRITDGADIIRAGDGNDTIIHGNGNDTVYGGAGNDFIDDIGGTSYTGSTSIFGGTGNDTVWAGDGNNTVFGEADDDAIYGEAGADSISGGTGNDYIDGGIGNDRLSGDDGNDTIHGGTGDDTIIGGLGNDSAFGGDGNDVIDDEPGAGNGSGTDYFDGGAGNDSIYGGNDNDTLLGGADNDFLVGEDGNDSIIGGTGNDRIFGGTGNDTFVYAPGDGNDTIEDFNFGNTGTLDDDDAANNDFINLSAYYDHISELYADQADDGILNQSNTTDTRGNAVDYSNNANFGTGSLTFTGASADSSSFTVENTGVVCFTPGIRILTNKGLVPVEELKVGDRVQTMDNGYQPIVWTGMRWIGQRVLEAQPELRPVLIQPGSSLGNEVPLMVSPQHRFVLPGHLVGDALSAHEAFIRAKFLPELFDSRARIANGQKTVSYVHIMTARHEIVFAEGVPTETFWPGPQALRSLSTQARDDLFANFPELGQTPAAEIERDWVRSVYGPLARIDVSRKDLSGLNDTVRAQVG